MYSSPRRNRFLPAALVALAAVPGGETPAAEPLDLPPALTKALSSGHPRTPEGLRLLQGQVRRVVQAGRPVTVAVEVDKSVGSGVIVSPDGLVLTAGHVCIEPNREVSIRFPDNTRVKGRSLGVNHRLDSGMVQITEDPTPEQEGAPGEWPYAPLAGSPLSEGQWVVGLGQPNGFVIGRAPPVRLGRVLYAQEDALNTDVTLVGGDSGGPLLNLRGEVVGIHSKIGEAITSNFHVPTTAYRAEWDRLLAGALTGIPEDEDPEDWRPHVGVAINESPDGVVVTQVFPGGAAAEALVSVGDRILEFGGESVERAIDLRSVVSGFSPYDRVKMLVERRGVTVELEVWLGRASSRFPGSLLAQEAK